MVRFSSFDEVKQLCRDNVPEGPLQLEFKEKNSPEKPELDSGDKKAIAKAILRLRKLGGWRTLHLWGK